MRSVRSVWIAWSVPVVILGLLGWANLALAQEKKEEPKHAEPKKAEPANKEKDILDTAMAADNLKTFAKLVLAAELNKEFKAPGPLTVFAPTDAAFDKLGKEKLDDLMKPEHRTELRKILMNHIVKGKHAAAEVKKMKEIKTEVGMVHVAEKDGHVMVGPAQVVKADIAASNGLIHEVDAVIMPGEKEKKEEKPQGGHGG